MNENTDTLTATRTEMKSLIDEAVTKRTKSLPDRSMLKGMDGNTPKNIERDKFERHSVSSRRLQQMIMPSFTRFNQATIRIM